MSEPDEWELSHGRLLRWVALGLVIFASACGLAVIGWLLEDTRIKFWEETIRQHFIATIGFIGIVTTAFGVVIFLRQSEGPIEFEALGMKFKGAAGDVVLWGFCVIVLSLCAGSLWWLGPECAATPR